MKLDDAIEISFLLQNNSPVDDFLGLSPTEIHYLLYDTFGDRSPVQLRGTIGDETLDQIPLFRIAEEFLKIMYRDKFIKLTPLGALPKKVMVELYEKRLLPDEHIESGLTKLWKEGDCISIMSARITTELAGLVRKAGGRLHLTKTATKLLEKNDRAQIFKQFFQAFTSKFNWSFNDGYPKQPIGQLGWAFSVFMLDKFGDQPRKVDFYASKYQKAFPMLLTFFGTDYSTPEEKFVRCYGIRCFHRFFLWFGFLTAEKQKAYSDVTADTYKRTDLVRSVFQIDDSLRGS